MKRLFKLLLLLVVVSLSINFLYRFDILHFRSSFVFDFASPLVTFFEKPRVPALREFEMNKVLKNENSILTKEIQRLKKELATREDFTREYIEAKIISFDGDRIQIDKGMSAGVTNLAKVIVGQSLVGNVISTEKYKSLVGLLNNSMTKNFCYGQQNNSNIWGVLTGRQGEKVVLTKITQEKQIEKGTPIYCEGFYVGEVSKINQQPSELFYEAEVNPHVDVENLDTVYVVKDK